MCRYAAAQERSSVSGAEPSTKQSLGDRPTGDLRPRVEAQFLANVFDVERRRALSDDQVLGNLPAGAAARHERRHFSLTRGQSTLALHRRVNRCIV